MKIIKRGFFASLLLALALSIYIWLGSIDMGTAPAVRPFPPFDDPRNGFLKISYLNAEEFLLEDDQREAVKRQLNDNVWSDSYAALIAAHAKHIDDYLSVEDAPYLQIPPDSDPNIFPNHANIMDVGRLALLKSRQTAERGELDAAVFLALNALRRAAHVKAEKGGYLLSFMIGVAMQNDALRWINRLSQNYPVSAANQRQLLLALNALPSFHADGFKEVFAGEYRFAAALTDQIQNTPLAERWQTYRNDTDYWNSDLDVVYIFGRENMREELYAFLSALFPRFYTHRDSVLTQAAHDYALLAEQAGLYCNQVSIGSPAEEPAGVTWSMLILPNSAARLWQQKSAQQFYPYFLRRCLSQTHIEATRVLIALRIFHMNYGDYPAGLGALAQGYFEQLPVDPFDGQPLRYSSGDQWVYSVGADCQDDGGATDACFLDHPCFPGQRCADEPTFPLFERICSLEPSEQE